MKNELKYKYVISGIEGLLLGLAITFSILMIFDLAAYEFLAVSEVFELWSFRLAIVCFVIFISFPYLVNIVKKIVEKNIRTYNQRRFQKEFPELMREREEINILNLANKYGINLVYIKNFLRDQMTQGYLKGELVGDIFEIKSEFKDLDTKEQSMEFFKENVQTFVAPHSLIKIREIANYFKLPKNVVKLSLSKMIAEGKIRGFLQGNALIRSFKSSQEIECPHCKKKIDLTEL